VFWVISVLFNIRNALPKFCPFLLGHPVYTYIHTYVLYLGKFKADSKIIGKRKIKED